MKRIIVATIMKHFFGKILLLLVFCLGASQAAGAGQKSTPLAGQVDIGKLKPGFSNMILLPMETDLVAEDLQKIVILCATATPEAASRISPSSKNMLVSVIQLLRAGKPAKALQEWQGLVLNLKNSKSSTSINELIYWIGRQAYLKNEKELNIQSFRIRNYTAQQARTQEQLQQYRFRLNNCLQTKGCITGKVRDLQKKTNNLENELKTVMGDKSHSQKLLAQEILKSSSNVQNLADISRKMHDSARAIISYP